MKLLSIFTIYQRQLPIQYLILSFWQLGIQSLQKIVTLIFKTKVILVCRTIWYLAGRRKANDYHYNWDIKEEQERRDLIWSSRHLDTNFANRRKIHSATVLLRVEFSFLLQIVKVRQYEKVRSPSEIRT
jgi:hypothetical protein